MKKGLLITIILIIIALIVLIILLIQKPAHIPATGGATDTLNALVFGSATSETNDAAIISNSSVVDSAGLT